jgi:enoyl-CoA hydratase/3-hydroxyacyl-CoA dehydrogenase
MYETVLLKREPEHKIAWLILNRPEKLNTFNLQLIQDISKALTEIEKDNEIWVLILTGAGEKAFSAGADLTAYGAGTTPEKAQELATKAHKLFHQIEKLPQPVIAAINGYAFGGGCEIALACDFRIAAERVKMGLTEVRLSLLPAGGGTQRMPRLIGVARAKEAIMLSKRYSAKEALEIGLVHTVVPNESFEEDVLTFAKELASEAPIALQLAKQCINQSLYGTFEAGLELEAQSFGKLFSTKDFIEGVSAFLQKRKPKYSGE